MEKLFNSITPSVKARFLSKFRVDDSGCWIWIASHRRNGYGQFRLSRPRRTMIEAHRMSWYIFRGPVQRGLCVLHHCDVRSCINPDHLFIGTKRDNLLDMISKGRQRLGPESKTGLSGVYLDKRSSNWVARATRPSRAVLYTGKDFFDACCARRCWELRAAQQASVARNGG
jgi:hypothetical protein